jgi:Tol biopolymer transport system component
VTTDAAEQTQIALAAADGSGVHIITRAHGPLDTPRWSPDGKHIYSIGYNRQRDTLWAYSLADKKERPLTEFRGRRGRLGSMGLCTDGKYLYFTWEESRGDIWIADVVAGGAK